MNDFLYLAVVVTLFIGYLFILDKKISKQNVELVVKDKFEGNCAHDWIKDSSNNWYCFKCNKMPFEVPKEKAPANWWKGR